MKAYVRNNRFQLLAVVAIVAMSFFGYSSGVVADPVHAAAMSALPLMALNTFAPFPVTPEYTAVAVAYKTEKLVADEVMPRVPVSAQTFKYLKYPMAESFTVPKTEVGRKGQPNQVEFTATEDTSATVDHALDDPVPHADIENARAQPGVPDPLMRATRGLTKLIELGREIRVAGLIFNPNSYAATHRDTLAGTDQWSDYAESNPLAYLMDTLDSMIMRGNVLVLGRRTWTVLAQHPKLCKAVFGNNTDAGVITRQALATLLELDQVIVGEGWVNTAAKGQVANMVRVWGNHAALLYRNKDADTQSDVTFGLTAQWGTRVAGAEYDKNIGMRGGQIVRVGESVKELITANDLGFFVQDAVAYPA